MPRPAASTRQRAATTSGRCPSSSLGRTDGTAGAGASAQTNLVHNGGFEIPGSDPSRPEGWAPFNTARYREIGDGQGEILVHSGTHSVELASGSNFVGYTTDVFNPATLGSYAGGSQPHENRQPFLTLNYVIALQGIYPSRN